MNCLHTIDLPWAMSFGIGRDWTCARRLLMTSARFFMFEKLSQCRYGIYVTNYISLLALAGVEIPSLWYSLFGRRHLTVGLMNRACGEACLD